MKLRINIATTLLILALSPILLFSQKTVVNPIYKLINNKNDSISTSITSVANFINNNFKSEEEKAKAIFYWTTKNIAYDIENQYTFSFNLNKPKTTEKAFYTKKAVCYGYACLFDTLCRLSNLKSQIVIGSVRQTSSDQNLIAHAWNACFINQKWVLFDPTWGAGTINNRTFTGKLNEKYLASTNLSETHHPFDPIWQLSNDPLNQREFFNPKFKKTAPLFSFNYYDSITFFLNQSSTAKLKSVRNRLKNDGIEGDAAYAYYSYLETLIMNIATKDYNNIVASYNYASDMYNEYINFKNKQFTPTKPDSEIKSMITDPEGVIEKCKKELIALPNDYADLNENSKRLLKNITDFEPRIAEEKQFVEKYLQTPPKKRKDLFYKKVYTFWGIPLNK